MNGAFPGLFFFFFFAALLKGSRASRSVFYLGCCTESLGMQRLNTIVSGLVLRRTKEEMGPELLKLTKRMVETHRVQLKPAEQQVYDALFFEARYSLCYLLVPRLHSYMNVTHTH